MIINLRITIKDNLNRDDLVKTNCLPLLKHQYLIVLIKLLVPFLFSITGLTGFRAIQESIAQFYFAPSFSFSHILPLQLLVLHLFLFPFKS